MRTSLPGAQPALGAARDLALAEALDRDQLDLARPALGAGGDRRHEGRLARRATAPLAAGARAAEVSIVHLHPPRQRRVCLAPRHHRHDLVLHGPGGRLLDPETAPQLDRGNPVLRRYDQVDGREPQRQRQLGGVEDRARRGGCLLLAPVALVEAPARQHTMPAMAAGGADEAVRPAQPGQCRAALLLGAEGFAKRLVAQPAHPRCNLEPHIRNLPRQERTKNICLPKRSVTDKQDSIWNPRAFGIMADAAHDGSARAVPCFPGDDDRTIRRPSAVARKFGPSARPPRDEHEIFAINWL